jgi:hypothetical protein
MSPALAGPLPPPPTLAPPDALSVSTLPPRDAVSTPTLPPPDATTVTTIVDAVSGLRSTTTVAPTASPTAPASAPVSGSPAPPPGVTVAPADRALRPSSPPVARVGTRRPPPVAVRTRATPLPQLAARTAKDFSVPFTLAFLVLVFLAVQHQLDARDPGLLAAPIDDDMRSFS